MIFPSSCRQMLRQKLKWSHNFFSSTSSPTHCLPSSYHLTLHSLRTTSYIINNCASWSDESGTFNSHHFMTNNISTLLRTTYLFWVMRFSTFIYTHFCQQAKWFQHVILINTTNIMTNLPSWRKYVNVSTVNAAFARNSGLSCVLFTASLWQ
jgi:hypothetical protein